MPARTGVGRLKSATAPDENPRPCASASTSGARRSRASRSTTAGAVLARRRVADAARTTTTARSAAIAALVRGARGGDRAPAARSASACPGAVSPATGLVKNANSTWLIGPRARPRPRAAASAGPSASPTTRTASRSRRRWTARARAARVVFGVIVGTGTGGGIVVDRKVLTGPNAIAGEWGHNPLPWPRAGRVAGAALLLRQDGLRRDVPLGPGPRARPPRARRASASRARRSWRGPSAGDAAAARRARPLRGADGARARGGAQHPRPRRGRARRRHVADRPGCTRTCRGCGSSGPSPTAWTPACDPRSTATRAACAARRGSGARREA